MKEVSMDDFIDQTALMPNLVAEKIMETSPLLQADKGWFVSYVETYTLWLYNNSPQWRNHLRGESGRDWLYNFVRHWFQAYSKHPPTFRQRHSLAEIASPAV